MKLLDIKSTFGMNAGPWFDLFQLNVDRNAAAAWFSYPAPIAPAHVDWVEGLGKADFWAVEFPCGLKVGFYFLHSGSPAAVLATEPVPQHVVRHLRHWRNELQEYAPEIFERDRLAMIEDYSKVMPELKELQAYQLWRQGDDGNPIEVGAPTSKRDAECWQAELESHKHKQIYWITRTTDLAGA